MTAADEANPVPFFKDERTLGEKLAADEREWRPHEPEYNCPAVIAGLMLERGTFISKFNKEHHTARILTAGNVIWSVITFHGYLQSEFDRKDPRVGDFVAAAFRGTKPAKREGESDAFDYRLEVERNPDAVETEENDRGNQTLAGSDPAAAPPTNTDVPEEGPDDGVVKDDIPF